MKRYLILILMVILAGTASAKKVKFAVDMTGQTVNTTGVHVSGDFQDEAGFEGGDWQSNTTLMTNEPGTQLYSVVVDIPAFAKYEYKFINGDQWYEVEYVPAESRVGYEYNDNRWVYIDSLYNDTTMIAPVMFSGNAPLGFDLVRVKVDMGQVANIDPAGVHVAQDEQLGSKLSTIMYSFGENIYEQIIYAPIWTDYSQCIYVFINGNTTEGYETVPPECSADGYRNIVTDKDTVIETVCFGKCTECDPQGLPAVTNPGAAKIYPNPMKDRAILEFNDKMAQHRVIITDMMGNTVRKYDAGQASGLIIYRDNLKKGNYFIRISSNDDWLSTLKLLVTD